MAGYTRQSESGIVDGGVISASDFNEEFNCIACAMGTSGHTHDGTAGNGPKINTAGIATNAVTTDKINTAAVTGAKIDSSTTITAACFCGNVAGNATGITNVTATTAELNCLSGLTATTTELNYVDGVTSSIQTQLDEKISNICDDASPQLGANLDANCKGITSVYYLCTCTHGPANAGVSLFVNNLYDEAEIRGNGLSIYAQGSCGLKIATSGALYGSTSICVCCNGTCGLSCDDACVILYSRNSPQLCTTPTGVNMGCLNLLCATFNGGGGIKFAGQCKFCCYVYGCQVPGFTFTGIEEAGNTLQIGACSCVLFTHVGNITQVHGFIETSCVALCCPYNQPLYMCNIPGGLYGNSCVRTQHYKNIFSCGWCSSTCVPDIATIECGSGIAFLKPDGTTLKACDLTCHSSGTSNKIHFNFVI